MSRPSKSTSSTHAKISKRVNRRRDKFLDSVDIKESDIHREFAEAFRLLLADKTTGKNIIWATSDYADKAAHDEELSDLYRRRETDELIAEDIATNFIKPRCVKSITLQRFRTKERAEVFTPSWVCNKQNNLIDEAWFGEKRVFNCEDSNRWKSVRKTSKHWKQIVFPDGKTWRDYVSLVRMELACGEAPYLASRYDSAPVKPRRKPGLIKIEHRIGLLDRKLRVVSENTETPEEFFRWTKRAFQSIYAFEFQGDSLLIARENLLFSFYDYFYEKFCRAPSKKQMTEIAEIVAWNVFQMDALTLAIPEFPSEATSRKTENSIDGFQLEQENLERSRVKSCLIKDWTTGQEIPFKNLLKDGGRGKEHWSDVRI